ncbi:Hypothetical protein CINCED_3A021697 [Cinara cedri]|uniref:Uncharacterized protein n=1 Tax=Cinara cedri TaxID=506608 RepID=A0A5E4MLD4_9HEMI|nr:Hypothetical protein CINCED_3A021697 [Cinara cedri]
MVDLGLSLPKMSKPKLNIWNVKKADWVKYTTSMEENKNHMSRYLECNNLLSEYEQMKSEVTANRLTKLLDEERR